MNQQPFISCYGDQLCLLNSAAYVVQCTSYFSCRAIQKTIQHLNKYFKGLICSACHHFQIIMNSTLMHICNSHSEGSFFLDFLLLILNHPLYCPAIKKLKKKLLICNVLLTHRKYSVYFNMFCFIFLEESFLKIEKV